MHARQDGTLIRLIELILLICPRYAVDAKRSCTFVKFVAKKNAEPAHPIKFALWRLGQDLFQLQTETAQKASSLAHQANTPYMPRPCTANQRTKILPFALTNLHHRQIIDAPLHL